MEYDGRRLKNPIALGLPLLSALLPRRRPQQRLIRGAHLDLAAGHHLSSGLDSFVGLIFAVAGVEAGADGAFRVLADEQAEKAVMLLFHHSRQGASPDRFQNETMRSLPRNGLIHRQKSTSKPCAVAGLAGLLKRM